MFTVIVICNIEMLKVTIVIVISNIKMLKVAMVTVICTTLINMY